MVRTDVSPISLLAAVRRSSSPADLLLLRTETTRRHSDRPSLHPNFGNSFIWLGGSARRPINCLDGLKGEDSNRPVSTGSTPNC
ncbi:hypothetical protein [Sphingomonas sp. PP-CE-1G-424]|uniref:hypothetical protein n=1 Tax=Sphingomonas sp. PP-CE-1G-424 TaxID=2135658 RepID=UPI001A9ED753|nr:hypothetical protein [Sphingomonas sp. PP-CE-1G-424]